MIKYLILEEQDIPIDELERRLKGLSKKFRNTLYKNNDYKTAMDESGFYIFVYWDQSEDIESEITKEFKQNEIIAICVNEKEFKEEYGELLIVLLPEQSHDYHEIDHYLYEFYEDSNLANYKYKIGEFEKEIEEEGCFVLYSSPDHDSIEEVLFEIEIYNFNYVVMHKKLFQKMSEGNNKNLSFDGNKQNKEQNNVQIKSNNLDLSISKLKTFDEFFANKLIGQDEVVQKLKEQLITKTYDLDKSSTRPVGIFLFVGPTGVGKTEMCKVLSEFLYNNKNINRFDMSEYKSEVAIQKLIGAPNGYVGYEEGGTLINAMIKNPNSIVLFDEIEKADSHVFDLFLQMFDEGVVTSNKGEKICFKNNFIILTSNIGANLITNKMKNDISKKIIRDAVHDFFSYELNRPEIIGRVGKENIISFNPINKEKDQFKILDIYFDKFIEQIKEKSIKTKFNKENVYRMILQGVDITKGARDIRNEFDQFKIHFNKALFEKDLDWDKLKNKTLVFGYNNKKVSVEVTK